MTQNKIIPSILQLNKLITLTIDNYFINYETLKMHSHFYEYEQLQIQIHSLREQLIKGFSWYCGSTIEQEKKRHLSKAADLENKDPFKQQYNLLQQAIVQNNTICNGIVANYDYKNIFLEIKTVCDAQLNLLQPLLNRNTTTEKAKKLVLA